MNPNQPKSSIHLAIYRLAPTRHSHLDGAIIGVHCLSDKNHSDYRVNRVGGQRDLTVADFDGVSVRSN